MTMDRQLFENNITYAPSFIPLHQTNSSFIDPHSHVTVAFLVGWPFC